MTTISHFNLLAGWIGMLFGILSGAALGLFFHKENWAGGYTSYRRRMMRLGHIAFFGLGLLNIVFALTQQTHPVTGLDGVVASAAFLIGLATMPPCCFLAAWKPHFRHLFPIPVLTTSTGVILITLRLSEVFS